MPTFLAPIRSICLVRLSALGDVVMVLPLVRAIQAQMPSVKITWVIARGAFPLVRTLENEGVEFVVMDKPNSPADYFAFYRSMANRRFDILLCLQAAWRANLLYPLIRADRKIGFRDDRAKDAHGLFVSETIEPRRSHNVDAFLQFGERIGVSTPQIPEWRLTVEPEAADWAKNHLPNKCFLALCPAASKPERNWSVEHYAEVARALRQRHGLAIVLLGGAGPFDKRLCSTIENLLQGVDANLAGQTTLPQLVAALGRARLILAPDTGAVHIATALGRPVVGLYASAQSARTGPYLRSEFCVDRYDQAVGQFLRQDAARAPWELRVHDPRSMQLITVPDVLANCEAALEASQRNGVLT